MVVPAATALVTISKDIKYYNDGMILAEIS